MKTMWFSMVIVAAITWFLPLPSQAQQFKHGFIYET